jgi:hypothetical protein
MSVGHAKSVTDLFRQAEDVTYTVEQKMARNLKRSLQDVVGENMYSAWVDMLRRLVPDGRTHRLSVLLAGMLQYALTLAEELNEDELEEELVAVSLINANEMGPDEIKDELHDVMTRLFKDAGVTFDRVSKRGELYSIADEAYDEFVRWYDYPWD